MLSLQLERVKRARLIDKLVVATSDVVGDQPIVSLCNQIGVECYTGSLQDVLDRFYCTAKIFNAEHVVRLTADCPLADPQLIDQIISKHLRSKADYTSNTLTPTFPDGLDVEILTVKALAQAWNEARLPSEREHVTPFIKYKPSRFKCVSYTQIDDLSDLRWTVDHEDDLEFVTLIYQNLYSTKPAFNTQDILTLLKENPEFIQINSGHVRNAGYASSLNKDKVFLNSNVRSKND